MPLVGMEDAAAAASLLLSASCAAIETRLWMLKVQGEDAQAARLSVVTNCTAAVISAAASPASPAAARASAVDALGSECPMVVL